MIQKMEHVNIAVLGVSERMWTRIGNFQSGNYKLFYTGNSRRNGVG